MLIQETWLERESDERHSMIGKSGLYEPFTDNLGKLFKSLQKECGRCISKIYTDDANGQSHAIGWVFVKRTKYTDCNKTYLAETWVELHESKPDTKTTYHYHYMRG